MQTFASVPLNSTIGAGEVQPSSSVLRPSHDVEPIIVSIQPHPSANMAGGQSLPSDASSAADLGRYTTGNDDSGVAWLNDKDLDDFGAALADYESSSNSQPGTTNGRQDLAEFDAVMPKPAW